MRTLQRAAAALIYPAILCLGVACERSDTLTKPSPPAAALQVSSSATTHWVNGDGDLVVGPGTSCENPGYKTVQAAVTTAGPDDRINVCPGTYVEEVSISGPGKNNIALRSVRRWEAVIKAPTLMFGSTKAIVRVSGAQNITILAFTITGPGGSGCDALRYGVRVDGGGSADILGNHITQIRDNPFSGCQNGVAVLVGRQAEATTGSARIIGNVIDNYQKNGPTVSRMGSYAEISYNRILGIGPTAVIAQNGIQASSGATGVIRHNFVAQNIYTPQTVVSTGVLLFQSGEVETENNTVASNDIGIYMLAAASGSKTPRNRVRASSFDGIVLDVAAGNQVADNNVEHNKGPGIGVYDGSQNNIVEDNKVEDNDDSGILLDDGQNNSVGDNKVRDNGTAGPDDATDGIRINMLSSGNTVHDNRLRHNVTHDCHDNSMGTGTAGTGNSWINNDGTTSNPPGLCGEDDNDADFETSTMYGWDAAYPWYDAFGIATTDYDFATAYATIDTESLLQLLPQVRLPGVRRAAPSPDE